MNGVVCKTIDAGSVTLVALQFTNMKVKDKILLVLLLIALVLTYWGSSTLNELLYYLDDIEHQARYGSNYQVVNVVN